jgi:hypothetical protein
LSALIGRPSGASVREVFGMTVEASGRSGDSRFPDARRGYAVPCREDPCARSRNLCARSAFAGTLVAPGLTSTLDFVPEIERALFFFDSLQPAPTSAIVVKAPTAARFIPCSCSDRAASMR